MGRISQRTIDAVKEKAQILDVFEGVELKRMGREHVTKCPWHNDRRPSLAINPQKNFAYCHVCQHGVDSLGWLQDRGSTFAEAVEFLAERYSVQVEFEKAEDNEKLAAQRKQKAQLYTKREKQQAAFAEKLWSNRDACLYLKNRGISRATAEAWGLGLADGRLMIPLRDPQGRVVAFTGRSLGDQMPKYKNSPNDVLFDKSRMVFGLDKAIGAIRSSREVVIVEGQFDVIQLHQAGIENVIAVSGTAFTGEQIDQLVRRSGARTVTLCFDGDAAGEKAARAALEKLQVQAIREEINLRILTLEPGQDPDTICREQGSDATLDLLRSAPNWVEWWLERELAKVDLNSVESVTAAEHGVARILKALPRGPRRTYVERKAKEVLGSAPRVKPAPPVETKAKRNARKWAERRALRAYLLLPAHRSELEGVMAPTEPPFAIAWGLVQAIKATLGDDNLAPAFGMAIASLSEDDFQELRSLINPVPEVRAYLQSNGAEEIKATIEQLKATAAEP